jgi:hypothetical protein
VPYQFPLIVHYPALLTMAPDPRSLAFETMPIEPNLAGV